LKKENEVVVNQHFTFFRTEMFTFLVFVFTIVVFGEAETGSAEEQPIKE